MGALTALSRPPPTWPQRPLKSPRRRGPPRPRRDGGPERRGALRRGARPPAPRAPGPRNAPRQTQ
eukprot:4820365-Pyramimonas_sp.AAC.1